LAATERLQIEDTARDRRLARFIAEEIGAIFGGKSDDEGSQENEEKSEVW